MEVSKTMNEEITVIEKIEAKTPVVDHLSK